MTDRITKKDIDAVIENLNKSIHIRDNGLKIRYYKAYDTYRIGLILNPETNSEKEFKHELNHKGVYLSLLNFQNLLWIWQREKENTSGYPSLPIERDTVIQILDNCGFTYSR